MKEEEKISMWEDNKLYVGDWPKMSGWECDLFGMKNGLTYHPQEGHVPNFFWRWMQYIFFGNRWVKK